MTKGERTKKIIFDTSVELFKEHGYTKVTISDITKACNISKGSFYTHFTSKADIIDIQFEVVDDLYNEYYIKNHYKGCEALEKFLEYVFYVVENNVGKEMVKNLYAEHLLAGNIRALTSEGRNLYKIIRQISTCEEMNSIDAEEVIIATTMIIRGVCYEWSCSDDSIEKFYKTVVSSFILGLRNRIK